MGRLFLTKPRFWVAQAASIAEAPLGSRAPEVVYYLSCEDVGRLAASVTRSLAPDGSVILVHWTGSTNYPLSGDEAVALFIEQMGSGYVVRQADRYAEFRLGVLSRS
jgi:hypothetical protein